MRADQGTLGSLMKMLPLEACACTSLLVLRKVLRIHIVNVSERDPEKLPDAPCHRTKKKERGFRTCLSMRKVRIVEDVI